MSSNDFLGSSNRRAEDGAQTRDPQLGRLVLYQLSYFRDIILIHSFVSRITHTFDICGLSPHIDVGRDGFEPPKP